MYLFSFLFFEKEKRNIWAYMPIGLMNLLLQSVRIKKSQSLTLLVLMYIQTYFTAL